MGNLKAVQLWLSHGSTPVAIGEMRSFWQSCSEEEKQQFGDTSRRELAARGVDVSVAA